MCGAPWVPFSFLHFLISDHSGNHKSRTFSPAESVLGVDKAQIFFGGLGQLSGRVPGLLGPTAWLKPPIHVDPTFSQPQFIPRRVFSLGEMWLESDRCWRGKPPTLYEYTGLDDYGVNISCQAERRADTSESGA